MPGKLRKAWNKLMKKKKPSERILNVREIAEKIGAFPSDVEETVKELQEQGKVKCYMAEGELYVVFIDGTSMDDIQDYVPVPPLKKDDLMYR